MTKIYFQPTDDDDDDDDTFTSEPEMTFELY